LYANSSIEYFRHLLFDFIRLFKSLHNKITIEPTQETKIAHTSFYNCIDALLSIINTSIQKKKNATTKWGNYINITEGIIKNKTTIYNFKVQPKQKILEDLIYHKEIIAYTIGNTDKKRLSRLANIGWSFFCLKQIAKKSRDLLNLP
ncbi:MAG: hypothetical protein ACEPOV_10240, partial [Hyphomicrobiales bacterium]